MANDIHNNVPQKNDSDSPLERFSGTKVTPHLRHFHHFGCPTYVLDGKIQQGQKIRKWQEPARVGIYLGHSPQHSRSVALVLSLTTGHVSPQYHCQFDDLFETVQGNNAKFVPRSQWQIKTHFHKTRELARQEQQQNILEEGIVPAPAGNPPEPEREQGQPQPQQQPKEALIQQPEEDPQHEPANPVEQEPQNEPNVNVRRSGRQRRLPAYLQDYINPDHIAFNVLFDTELTKESFDAHHPLQAFKTISDPDTMYLWQAMTEPDREQFKAAMEEEIANHTNNHHWEIVLKKDIPKGTLILPAVWSMKRKRRITTREVYKWKARLTIDGSKQKYGLHYDETYAPVVTWSSTRFFLIQSILHGWHSRQLDFLLAYPQADVERELYMEIPKGITIEGTDDRDKYALRIRVADRKKIGFGPVLGPKGPPGPRSDRRTDRFETACTRVLPYVLPTYGMVYRMLLLIRYRGIYGYAY
jgi:hypothetical protein